MVESGAPNVTWLQFSRESSLLCGVARAVVWTVFSAPVSECSLPVPSHNMDVTAAAAEHAGTMVKDELAEKCQKLFQAFLEE